MSRPIGYYVHHHGAGHRARARIVADRAGGRITLIGTGLAGKCGTLPYLDLSDDRLEASFDGADEESNRPAALHFAPIDHDGVRRRVAAMAGWIAQARPALMVVDVSCEVAMLARLASVPTVVMRLGGVRDDAPHRDAFAAASAIVSPFAEALEDPATPDWVREKTHYFPGLVEQERPGPVDPGSVLVVLGQGGASGDPAVWQRAARATPDWSWSVIGPCAAAGDLPHNLALLGWVDDAAARISRAGVVVGSAGDGVVGAVLAAARPFICLPEDRPFEEQRSKAAALVRAGAALLCEDAAHADWSALLSAAQGLSPDVAAALDDPDGADRFAAFLLALADKGHCA
jgi:hypothetical protein